MYEQFGYSVYRRVQGYYHSSSSGNRHEEEDAFGIYPWKTPPRKIKSFENTYPASLSPGRAYPGAILSFCKSRIIEKHADIVVDMRKALKRDKLRQSVRENGRNFLVSPEDVVF